MERKVNIRLGSRERAKEFVKAIEGMDCCFLIKLGKTALEATNMEDVLELDMTVPRPLCIYGDPTEVEQAVHTVGTYCV